MDGLTVNGCNVTLSNIHCENTVTLTFSKLPEEAKPTATATTTATAAPTATPTAEPTAAKEPTLADIVTVPEITVTENILYDDYIGTGSGLGQLNIVFEGGYHPREYALLSVKPDSKEQTNTEGFLPLNSTATLILEEIPENQPDEAAKFIVTMPDAGSTTPITIYDADVPLSREQHSIVTAGYAGKGCYRLLYVE